jgi:hypothetical protein
MIDHLDLETEQMMSVASLLTIQQKIHWPLIYRGIRERCDMFRSGRLHAPQWIRRELKALDPFLDIRWDYFGSQWIVDRYSRKDRAWVMVLEWPHSLDIRMIQMLQEADMWRFATPEDYLAYKRAKSAAKRLENEKKSDEKVAEAIDNLSRREAQEFVEVEQALKTGETVEFAGESLATMEKMHESYKRASAMGDAFDDRGIKILKPKHRGGDLQ